MPTMPSVAASPARSIAHRLLGFEARALLKGAEVQGPVERGPDIDVGGGKGDSRRWDRDPIAGAFDLGQGLGDSALGWLSCSWAAAASRIFAL